MRNPDGGHAKARATGPDLERIASADLKQLGDIRIDDVLSFIDRGIENMPSYMDLYRRWESQQWSVGDLDFTLDRQDWLKATDLERKSTLWSHRLFFNGEERVTATLAPSSGPRQPRRSRFSSPRRWSTRRGTPSSFSDGGMRWWGPRRRAWATCSLRSATGERGLQRALL